jgi:3-hydroxyacyl-[acyl-carrier-protein] dehydratase
VDDVKKYIPHRPPFLFVDEIIESTDESLTATRRVRPDEAFFAGHYPGNPIMPGVLIAESVFQAAAIHLVRTLDRSVVPENAVPVLVRISDARFRQLIRPGDVLTIQVRLKERMSKFFFMHGVVTSKGRRVMSIDFGVAMEAEGATPVSTAPE